MFARDITQKEYRVLRNLTDMGLEGRGRQVAISNSKQCEKENENLMTSMGIRRNKTEMLLFFREWIDGRMFSCYGQTENLMFTQNSCTLMIYRIL